MKVRVVNKNKNGVTFKILGLPKEYGQPKDTATWDEFNSMFEKVDGYIYETNKEFDEKQNEKIELFTKLMPHILSLRVQRKDGMPSLKNLSVLSHYQEKYHEKFGGVPIDFIREYRIFEEAILKNMMSRGIGVGEVHRKPYDLEDERPNKKEKEEVFTIGDALRAKHADDE